jgi:membrane protease YdiL (CAAX protease family)
VAFAIFILATSSAQAILSAAGFYRALYGDEFPAGLPDVAANTIRYLWAGTIAFPVQIGLVFWLIRRHRAGYDPIGPAWESNVVAGYFTWLMVTPAAFCVFALANLAHAWMTGQPPDKHPLTALGNAGGNREWALFVLETVVLAPVLEELLFRGLLLPWLATTRPAAGPGSLHVPPSRRPIAIMLIAVGVALILHVDDAMKARDAGDRYALAAHLVPAVFFLMLIPLFYLLSGLPRLRRHLRVHSRQHVQAILASSALFAAVHAHVWPSPVPLIVLAIGLGYLYLRTRSLLGPIIVHGMFNAVSAVYLLMGGPA